MKTVSLLALLAAAIYYYHGSPDPRSTATTAAVSEQTAQHRVVAGQIIVAPAPSYQSRWKTGENACAGLKTGPDAQVHWEPFLPDEQANWNQTPGYTIVSSSRFRIR